MALNNDMDLFSNADGNTWVENLASHVVLLHAFALRNESQILSDIDAVITAAPFRHMQTPGGHKMSVAMSNCGKYGWITDRHGYRYSDIDPLTGQSWPAMPDSLKKLAYQAAQAAGYDNFQPDACLINRYQTGAKMSLHQDKDEHDFSQPIVSVSLGIPAVFLLGGLQRSDKTSKVLLRHGDVLVWGGPDRLRFHGIMPIKPSQHPMLGEYRINLTFRFTA